MPEQPHVGPGADVRLVYRHWHNNSVVRRFANAILAELTYCPLFAERYPRELPLNDGNGYLSIFCWFLPDAH